MRLFCAVKVSPQVSQNLSHWAERMKGNPEIPPNTKWVEEQNFHLTLKFFGEVPEARLSSLEDSLGKAADGKTKFDISFKGIGAFPSMDHPRVIWAGSEDPSGKLSEIAEAIERQTVAGGFAPADKPFSPHLTLARLNHTARPGLPKVLEKHRDAFFGPMTVESVCLIQSTLSLQGSQYAELKKWSFK